MLPWPLQSGGQVRQFQLIGAARSEHQVTVIVEEYGAGTPAERQQLAQLWPDVRFIPASGSTVDGGNLASPESVPSGWRQSLRSLREQFDPSRSIVRGYRYPSTLNAVQAVIDEGVDLIEVEYVQMFRYLPPEPPCPVVLVALDVLGRRDRRARGIAGVDRHVALGDRRAQLHERSALRRADAVVVTGEEDARAAREAGAVDVRLVPNGADDTFLDVPEGGGLQRLLFVGWAGHSPNRDAVDWWLRDIAPQVDGDPVLEVAGSGWEDFGRHESLRMLGYVEDLRPLLSDALVVAPLRVGGGTKVKMVEAMAAARPIVGTTIAAEGLPMRDGVECLVRDTPEGFAAAIREIRQSPDLSRRLGKAARDAVRPLLWSAIKKQMAELYTDLASAAPRRSAG